MTTPSKAALPNRARRALGWTRLGMVAARITKSFWPLWSILISALGAIMLGFPWEMPLEAAWALVVLAALSALAALVLGVRRFRWPRRVEAEARLDETLPGRPLAALQDTLSLGAADGATQAIWRAHRTRMAEKANSAQPVRPSLRVARRDPYALRYVALLVLTLGLLFGSVLRVGETGGLAPGSAQAALGPAWEGWVEPPRYTGLPTIY